MWAVLIFAVVILLSVVFVYMDINDRRYWKAELRRSQEQRRRIKLAETREQQAPRRMPHDYRWRRMDGSIIEELNEDGSFKGKNIQ